MSDEVMTGETADETAVDVSVDKGDNAPAAEQTTLFDQVKALEADERKDDDAAALLELRLNALEAALSASQAATADMAARLHSLESAAPAVANEKLEALVAKMHEKMKLLIAMD